MTFREKVKNAMPIIGAHSNLTDAIVSEIFANLDYDFVWVDMEHTMLSCEQVYHHLLAIKSAQKSCVVRVPVTDLTYTKRVMEMGIDGIVFPMVRDAKHANELIDWTVYPPAGKRGCGPKGATHYGIDDESDYYVNGYKNICRFVQIEMESAALDAKNIAKNPYIDGCILGMHDLSGSIGQLGNIFCDKNIDLAMRAIDAFRSQGKTVGVSTYATDEETLSRYHDMGINMISTGADYDYIVKLGKKTAEKARKIFCV